MEFTNILSKANTWTLSTSMGSDYVASGDYSAHWIGSNENVTVTLPSLDVTAYRGSILKLKGNAYTSTPKDGPWTGITDSGSLIEVDFRDPEEEEYTTRQFYGAHEDEHEPFNVVDTTVPFEISISIPATTESIVIKLRHCYGSLSSGRTALLQIDNLMCYDASEEYTENPIHFHKVLASSLPTSVDPGSQHIYFAKGEEKTFMYVANNQGELEPISAVGAGGEQIQSDWNQTDATAVDFIRNKPTALSSFTDDLGSNPTHTHSQYSTTTTVNAINNRLIAVEGKIPSQASTTNQLADKSFVNSSIATNTANFLGTNTTATTEAAFLTWANALSNKTNNDYVFWGHSVDGNNVYDRYKYVASSPSWVYEYRLNNSSFTANQWAAINSGITEDLVEAFETHVSDEDVHVTTTEKEIWNGKANTNNPSFTGNVSINGTLKFQNNLTKVTSPTVVAAWVDNDSKKGLGFAQTSDLNVGHSTSADSVPWTGVSGKPDTFPPSSHAHSASDITSGTLDLARIPTIPSTKTSGFATVATSGSYNDLSNKPSIEDITYPYESSTYTGTEDWYIRIRSKNTYLNTNGYVKIHGEGSNRHSDTVICTCTRHNNFWGYTSHYNGKAVAGICSEYEAYNDLYIRVTNGFTSIKVYSTYEVNIDKADYSGKTYFNLPNGGFFASSLKGNLEGVASAAASVNWTGIQNKPSAYPPEAHSHSEYVKLSTTNTQQIESTSINRPLDLKGNSTYTLIGFRKSDGTYLGGLGANAENKPLFHNGSANVEISLAGHTHSEDVKLTSSGSQIINSISAATPVILKSAEPNRSQIGFYGSTGTNLGFLGVNTTGPYFLNNSTTTQLSLNGHTHDDRYYTETEINDKLATKSDTSHTHDDRYYTETEVNTKLSYKENSSNKVTSWSATVDDTHFPSEKLVKNALDGKASSSHTHDDRYYTESEIDTKLSGKSDTGHTHDDRYYTETEVNTKLDAKANLSGSTFTGDVIFNAPHRDTYYASNLCRHFSTNTPTEFVIKTKIKYVSASHMPLIRIHGYAFGQYSPIELKVAFYIYGGEFGWAGAVCTGAWKPEVYLFKYTENSVDYVAVGFKGACYYCGFQVDAQVGALGSFNSNFSIDGWSTAHNGADTSVSLIPAVGTSNCIKVDYKAIKTDISGSAGSVAWDNVTGKPSTYPPSSHNHDDRYYTETEINTKLSGKSDTGHTHDDRYYTESEIDTKLNTKENSSNKVTSWSTTTTDAHYPSEKLVKTALDSKASSSHTHDDRYYTEGEVDTKLSGKSDTGHTHDDRYYTEGEVDTKLSTKENSSNRVTSWSTTTTDTHYPSEKLVKTALDSKASSSHTHDDRYYTESEVDTKLSSKANTSGTYSGLNVGHSDNTGDGTINIIPAHSNEVNFGGYSTSSTIYFGYRAEGSKPKPTDYYFGSSGNAKLHGKLNWSDVTDTPSTFPPSSHNHDDRYYTESEIDSKLSGKSDTGHTHDDRYYTETEVNTLLNGKSNTGHTHDDRYYTEGEVDTKLATKANLSGATFTGPVNINAPHADNYYASNLCRYFSTKTPREIVVKTKIKYLSSTYMPVIKFYGYSYGMGTSVDLTIMFYIYGGAYERRSATCTGGWNPDLYLFKYTESGVEYVAVGIKPSSDSNLYYTGFQVDAQVGASGSFGDNFSISGWSTTYNTESTQNIIPAVGTSACVQVSYTSLATSINGSIAWGKITDKPSTFPPSSHNHDDRYYTESEMDTLLDGKANSSHGHAIFDVIGLQTALNDKENSSNKVTSWSTTTTDTHYPSEKLVKTALDGKSDTGHTHSASNITSGTFDLARIPTIPSSKTSGFKTVATSGSYNDLTDKPSIPTKTSQLTNDSGYNKEAYLEWGGKSLAGTYAPIDAALVPELGANRLAFGNPNGITVEYSRNSGSTWTSYGLSDNDKKSLLTEIGSSVIIGKNTTAQTDTSTYQARITIDTDTFGIYTVLNKFVIYVSTNGSSNCWCTIDASIENTPTTWVKFADKIPVSGWSGYNVINTSGIITYGNSPASQYGHVRFTFGCDSHPSLQYTGLQISKILGFGGVGWTTPSTMARFGRIFTYDADQNVNFPAKIKSNNTEVSLVGHTHDDRYYTESEIDTKLTGKSDTGHTHSASNITSGTFALDRIPTIPSTKTSGFATVATSGSYNNLTDKPSIPTKTSQLTNDSGFLTSHQDISGKENSSNKVTSWSTTTTDTHYPSEKLVKTALDNKASLSHEHGNIDNDGKLTTASRALVTDGNKKITTSNITSTELGYLSGVSSGIQSQLNSKADTTKALVLDNATIPEYSTTHNIKVYQQGGVGASVSVGPELLTFSNESEQTNLDVGVNRYTLYVETRDDPDAETYVSATRFLGTADAADSVPWDNVTGKPGTFPPSSHSHSEYVKHRTNGTSYNDLGSYYVGGSTATYVRVALPSTASTWAMLSYEFTVRENYGTGKIGKILVYGNWSSTAEWNQLTAIVSGSLSTNIKVYASDKKYIYIKGLSSYGGLTLDKVTAGDNITNYDISGIVIDGVSSLPSTYQTATMSYASYSGHTHDDRYYTESEIDTKLTGKSDTGHTHTTSQITNFPTIPSKTSQLTNDSGFLTSHQDISGKENSSNKVTSWSTTTTDVHYPSEKLVKTALDGKANTAHTHSISNVEGLQDALDSKVSSNGSYPNMSVGKADKLKLNDTTSLLATSFPVQITIGTDGVLHYKGYNSSGTGFVDLGTATVYACFS